MDELVVLVDAENRELGTMPKALVHTDQTPLHRAFSCFLFDTDNRFLISQRALSKKTWPGIWTNSFCGHPLPGESFEAAIRRRGAFELGLTRIDSLTELLPRFTYRAERDGIVENEFCPVWVGRIHPDFLALNHDEVEQVEWWDWNAFVADLARRPSFWSPWCRWETEQLLANPAFAAYREKR